MNATPHSVLLGSILGAVALLGCDTPPASAPGAPGPVETNATELSDEQIEDLLTRGGGGELSEADVFFEFNSTDDDLGLQLFMDGDGWRRARLIGPGGRRLVDFKAKGELSELGLTELRFESAEPSPAEVLERFPEGEYTIVALSVDGDVLSGDSYLSHTLPPAPVMTPTSGSSVPATGLVIEWDAIAGMEYFEVIVSDEDRDLGLEAELAPDATSFDVPDAFVHPGTSYKAEVLAVDEHGNKTITETEFQTE